MAALNVVDAFHIRNIQQRKPDVNQWAEEESTSSSVGGGGDMPGCMCNIR